MYADISAYEIFAMYCALPSAEARCSARSGRDRRRLLLLLQAQLLQPFKALNGHSPRQEQA